MHFFYNGVFLIAVLFWGKLENWKEYYSTILFFIACDFFANIITYNNSLWKYQETVFGQEILMNHTIINLLIMFVAYPATIFLFIGYFPSKKWKKIGWILFWVSLYSIVEYINLHFFTLITHHNGWNMAWSVLFNIVMFTSLRIHYRKPLLAWLIAAIWSVIIILYFNIPFTKMK
ncbi:CBO0543 family protein [Ornithinibacillus halophilus]|uniref:Uncharacterized protein n=1 Tax=Ornithinibacillus halophilus TaxID=930117 RepID=A0A1M5IIQ4_9BACI|nr:CBO0543 family protein [Ornithinibacillus halophilus]SHG28254.1 hypothetical protein SAMN05216225_102437 [Ornithinibacillus halophilus]